MAKVTKVFVVILETLRANRLANEKTTLIRNGVNWPNKSSDEWKVQNGLICELFRDPRIIDFRYKNHSVIFKRARFPDKVRVEKQPALTEMGVDENKRRFSVKKRRFYCKPCRKPFTEPIAGVGKGHRTTHRYRRAVLWACENFSDLARVRKAMRCSSGFIYQTLYEQIQGKLGEKLNYPWPTTIGVDEHFFTRRRGRAEFATVFIDYPNKRLRELAFGKVKGELFAQLQTIEGRENVRNVIIDMSDGYRSFIKDFFPNARIIADKFHVLRLLTPAINKRRVAITGDKRSLPLRRLLLKRRHKMFYYERDALDRWLQDHPELREIYLAKEALFSFYRIKGSKRAARVLTKLTDALAHSKIKELKKLRRTLMAWRQEILAYFETRLTNARTEGFNNVAKLVQKRAYGYKSFENYRLRLLNACL